MGKGRTTMMKVRSKKFKKGTKLDGKSVAKLLNFNIQENNDSIEQREMTRRISMEDRLMKGFYLDKEDKEILKKNQDEVGEPTFLISFANGLNTLHLAKEPIMIHDVTVSCVVDSCRV